MTAPANLNVWEPEFFFVVNCECGREYAGTLPTDDDESEQYRTIKTIGYMREEEGWGLKHGKMLCPDCLRKWMDQNRSRQSRANPFRGTLAYSSQKPL